MHKFYILAVGDETYYPHGPFPNMDVVHLEAQNIHHEFPMDNLVFTEICEDGTICKTDILDCSDLYIVLTDKDPKRFDLPWELVEDMLDQDVLTYDRGANTYHVKNESEFFDRINFAMEFVKALHPETENEMTVDVVSPYMFDDQQILYEHFRTGVDLLGFEIQTVDGKTHVIATDGARPLYNPFTGEQMEWNG